MKHSKENLDQLLLQFMDEAQARQFQADLRAADDLYDKHPVEPVRADALVAISKQIHANLKQRPLWIFAGKWATAAAVLAVVVLAGLFHLFSPNPPNQQPAVKQMAQNAFTESGAFVGFNNETHPLERELAELSEFVDSGSLDTYESINTVTIDLMELEEMELMAENTSFWKGSLAWK